MALGLEQTRQALKDAALTSMPGTSRQSSSARWPLDKVNDSLPLTLQLV